ncbi:hypothetical protein CEXT_311781 [Caerostris extrusa]|uniref:Uncharacterized protein n=1 Tax=Caerostris extrusa TaxID=172846 RepID=A0AAV4YDD3_CAEEX|nr:hypothetical protein CEXT_311781 [Caerostris extrusa]
MNGEIRPPLTLTQNRDSPNQAGDICLGGQLRGECSSRRYYPIKSRTGAKRYLPKHNLANTMPVRWEAFIRKWRERQRASLPANCFRNFKVSSQHFVACFETALLRGNLKLLCLLRTKEWLV